MSGGCSACDHISTCPIGWKKTRNEARTLVESRCHADVRAGMLTC